MTYEVRRALWSDVQSVAERLSDQNKTEYERVGGFNEVAQMKLLHFMMRGTSDTFWHDGKPQMVIAIADSMTWFIATKEFFAGGMAAVRAARRYMQAARLRHGPIVSVVTSQHPQAQRWMEVLGAKLVEEDDRRKVFLFA